MPDLLDPERSFAGDYEARHDAWRVFELPLDVLAHATFLDHRLAAVADGRGDRIAHAEVGNLPDAAPALLFHTAFCCSTLLARTLHAGRSSVSLKEPYALVAVAFAALEGSRPEGWAQDRARAALRLLGRPWTAGGRVLIKPANVANRLMPEILEASPRSRAVLLYGSLREFLVSCLKKLPAARTRVDDMARGLLRGTPLARALGIDGRTSLDFAEACVLAWSAQMDGYARALAADPSDRLRTLDMERLLNDPITTVRAAAQWLELPLDELAARVDHAFARHAKSPEQAFDPAQRARETAQVLAEHGAFIERAEDWARRTVEPALARAPDFKPLVR